MANGPATMNKESTRSQPDREWDLSAAIPTAQRSSWRRCDLRCAAIHHRVNRRWRPLAAKMHVYEIRPRRDRRGVDLISDVLPFGRLRYCEPNVVSYAQFFSRSHDAVIRVCDVAGNLIETHEHKAISTSGSPIFLFTIQSNTRLSSAISSAMFLA
jgi:hypothetical protein